MTAPDGGLLDPLAPLRIYQGGQCAICEERPPVLLVDHDHDTMLVRGLLCPRCNTTEGSKDWPWLRTYRAHPPAARIGLVVRYGRHQPRTAPTPRRYLRSWGGAEGWLERMLAAPVLDSFTVADSRPSNRDLLDRYSAITERLGYLPRPGDVSLDEWRAALIEGGSWATSLPRFQTCRQSWEAYCAGRALAQIARDREEEAEARDCPGP